MLRVGLQPVVTGVTTTTHETKIWKRCTNITIPQRKNKYASYPDLRISPHADRRYRK